MWLRSTVLLAALGAATAPAFAVGWKTQLNCASDYYAYCSAHSVGSPAVRKCMRANGPKLSKGCIDALIADGEITKEEVADTKKRLSAAKVERTRLPPKKQEIAIASAQPKKPEIAAVQPQPKKSDIETRQQPKVAAIQQVPPPPGREATRTAEWKTTLVKSSIALDQATFEALKYRGARFLIDDADPTPDAPMTSQPPLRMVAARRTAPAAIAPSHPTAPPVEDRNVDPPPAATSVTAARSEASDAAPVDFVSGRMSLGRKLLSAEFEERPPSLWEKFVTLFSSPGR